MENDEKVPFPSCVRKARVRLMKKNEEKSMFLIVFDHVNACASMHSLVKIHNNQVLFISTSGVPSVNKTDLQALTLAGFTVISSVQELLAVLNLDNRLFIIINLKTWEMTGTKIFPLTQFSFHFKISIKERVANMTNSI